MKDKFKTIYLLLIRMDVCQIKKGGIYLMGSRKDLLKGHIVDNGIWNILRYRVKDDRRN